MRHIKVLGLVAVAALVAMAFMGATSASAVTLCKENPKEGACPKGSSYPLKTKLSAALKEKTLAEGSDGKEFTVKCTEANWSGEATKESTEALEGTSISYTFGGCSSTTLGACNWVALNQPWALAIRATGNGNGTYTWTNGGTGVPGFRVTCGAVHCRYGANSIVETVTGGNPATATVNQALPLQTDNPENSVICGATFTYLATRPLSPAPMFIR